MLLTILPITIIFITIEQRKNTFPMHSTFIKSTLIFFTCDNFQITFTMADVLFKEAVVDFATWLDFFAEPVFFVFGPVAYVRVIVGFSVNTFSIFLTLKPCSNVIFTGFSSKITLSMLFAIFPFSMINISICPGIGPDTFFFAIKPFTFVFIILIYKNSHSVAYTILKFSVICISVFQS